jgi:menaquinone-dependent protoporphyrinogen oxidase
MVVFVAYATAHGSTQSIAMRIGARLRSGSLEVMVTPVAHVLTVGDYEAVILGSAIHNQAWLPEAALFVTAQRRALAHLPVWLFSVGMAAALRPIFRGMAEKEGDTVLAEFEETVAARGHRLFSGVAEASHFTSKQRLAYKIFGARFGDFRDWNAIDLWADEIRADLHTLRTEPGREGAGPPSG